MNIDTRFLSFTIYALIDPRTNEPFYVGRSHDLEQRLWSHVNNGKTTLRLRRQLNNYSYGTAVYRYIADMIEQNSFPRLMVLEDNLDNDSSVILEYEWALTLASLNFPIQNRIVNMVRGCKKQVIEILGRVA
jgi:hypothetical protein